MRLLYQYCLSLLLHYNDNLHSCKMRGCPKSVPVRDSDNSGECCAQQQCRRVPEPSTGEWRSPVAACTSERTQWRISRADLEDSVKTNSPDALCVTSCNNYNAFGTQARIHSSSSEKYSQMMSWLKIVPRTRDQQILVFTWDSSTFFFFRPQKPQGHQSDRSKRHI